MSASANFAFLALVRWIPSPLAIGIYLLRFVGVVESSASERHFCESVITHYDTFILRLQSTVGSPRGYAASAEASAVFFGLQVVPTSSKYGVTDSLSATGFASMPPPTGREDFENPLCHPSSNLRIFRWGREMRRGLCQPMLCLVCHPQERGTLLS